MLNIILLPLTIHGKVCWELDTTGLATAKKHGLNPYQHKIRLAAVEEKIQQLEVQIDALTDAIDVASASGDSAKVRELSEAYNTAQAELDAVMAEWELLLE